LKLQSPSKYSPSDWIQQSQCRFLCWKLCLQYSTEMLSRAARDSCWTFAIPAKCLCFQSCFIHGNKKRSQGVRSGQYRRLDITTILFFAKREAFCWHCRGYKDTNRTTKWTVLITKSCKMSCVCHKPVVHATNQLCVPQLSGVCHKPVVTFKQPDWYLNFSSWFMKNISFEQKKIILWNKWNSVVNKTEIMQHVLKLQ